MARGLRPCLARGLRPSFAFWLLFAQGATQKPDVDQELQEPGQCTADNLACEMNVALLQHKLIVELATTKVSLQVAPEEEGVAQSTLTAMKPAPVSLVEKAVGRHRSVSTVPAFCLLALPFALMALVAVCYLHLGHGDPGPKPASDGSEAERHAAEAAPAGTLLQHGQKQAAEEAPEANRHSPVREQPPVMVIVGYVVAGSICASMLTIVNKMALRSFHKPIVEPGARPEGYVWSLVVIQFLTATFTARLAGALGLVDVTPFEFRKALAFFPAAGMFMLTIAAGNAVMNYSNVNTFLVLRSLVPLPCALAETFVYSEPWPPALSGIALLVTVGGAAGYGAVVGGFELNSISWALLFLVMMPIDAILIKHSISSLDISPWGLVYYNNLLAALPAMVYIVLFEASDSDSFNTMLQAAVAPQSRLIILLSCFMGVAISYFQMNTRYYVSATAFMVLGVVNKFATVLVNNVILEHQGAAAFICILISLSGAVLWQLTVKSNSIKVRGKDSSWEKNAYLPFGIILVGLVWAGWVEWEQVHREP